MYPAFPTDKCSQYFMAREYAAGRQYPIQKDVLTDFFFFLTRSVICYSGSHIDWYLWFGNIINLHLAYWLYSSGPPVLHLSLAVTPIVLFILLLNKSVSFQKAVFWLILHNKPLETWLFTHFPDIILMDFGTHRQTTGRPFSKRFFVLNWCRDIKISKKIFCKDSLFSLSSSKTVR